MIVDKDLMLAAGQAQAGNERAFYYLYKRTYPDIYFRGMLLMENKEQTKELCRQVYLLVYRRIGQLENIQQLSQWMYQLLYTSAAKAWRSLPEYMIPEDKLEIVQTIEFYNKSEKLEEQVRDKTAGGISREIVDKLSNNQRVVWKEHIWQDLSILEISQHHQCEEKRVEKYLEQAWDEIGKIKTEGEFPIEEAKTLYGDVCHMINEGIYPSLNNILEKKEINSEFANVNNMQNQSDWDSFQEDSQEDEEYGEEDEYEEEDYEEEEDQEYDKEKLDRKKKQMVILFAASGIVVFIIIAILLVKNGFGGKGADDREYTRRETTEESKSKKKKETKKETTSEQITSSEVMTTSQTIDTSEPTTSKKPKETTSKETTSKETTSKEPDTPQESSEESSQEPDTSDTTDLDSTEDTSLDIPPESESSESTGESTNNNAE